VPPPRDLAPGIGPVTFEQIEPPQRAAAQHAAARARKQLAEDEATARACEDQGEWHATRHDTLPLIQVNVVTADETEPDQIGEYVAWDVARSNGVHIARHPPRRVLDQCGALGDVLTDLERIAERSPDPDSRMCARGAIHTLARIWEPDEPLHAPDADGHQRTGDGDD